MRRFTIAVSILASLVALAGLAARTVEAKGPFFVEISGGQLNAPITLPGEIDAQIIFAEGDVIGAPSPLSTDIYAVTLFGIDPRTRQRGEALAKFSYYRADDGGTAALRGEDGTFFAIGPEFRRLLNSALSANTAAFPQSGGPPADDSGSPVWYAVVATGLLAILVAGLAWRSLLR